MALNWSIAKVEKYDELLDKENCLKSKHANIVLATMQVGINEITQNNWEEFYKRINFIEKVYGTYNYIDDEGGKVKPDYIKEDDIKRLIGLHTNATRKSPTQFLQQFIDQVKTYKNK